MKEVFRVDVENKVIYPEYKKDEYRYEKHIGKYYHLYKWIPILIIDILPVMLIIFNYQKLYFWISLLPLYIPLAFVNFFAFKNTCQFFWYFFRVKYFEATINLQNYFVVRCGCPGSGKTSSSIVESYYIACMMWEELKWAYLTTCQKWNKIKSSGNKKNIDNAMFIFKSYNFWNTHKNLIPCLCSNIDITDNCNRSNYHIDKDNLLQKRPIPYMAVVFYDEIGLDFPCSNSSKNRDKWRPVASLGRLTRHFGEFHFIITEQDKSNVFKDLRRVVSENRTMQKQEWVCRAGLLNWFYNRSKRKVIKKCFGKYDQFTLEKVKKIILSRKYKRKVKFLIKLNVLIRSCGFRKYRYINEGNIEFNNDLTDISKVKSFVLNSNMIVNYDDKYYSKDYTVKEQELINEYNLLISL